MPLFSDYWAVAVQFWRRLTGHEAEHGRGSSRRGPQLRPKVAALSASTASEGPSFSLFTGPLPEGVVSKTLFWSNCYLDGQLAIVQRCRRLWRAVATRIGHI